MRNSLFVVLSVLALIAFSQAAPSFRILQNATVVDNSTSPSNTTVADNSTSGSNTTVVDNSTSGANTTAVNNSSSGSNVTVVNNSTSSNSSNSTNSTNTTASNPHPGYTQLNVSNLYSNQTVNAAFLHGMNAVIQTAIYQGKIPLSLYNITQWQGAWVLRRRGGANYIFQALLVGANGVNVNTNVTVYHSNSDNSNTLIGYNYRASNISRNAFPTGGYKALTPAQLHNNTIVQGALVWGAKTVIENLINANKIPGLNTNYTVYNLYQAVYLQNSTGNSYKFQIFAKSGDGINLLTNYTVFYTNANKSYATTAYWYRASNFSKSELNNTNSSSGSNVTVVNNSTSNSSSSGNTTVVNNSTSNSSSSGNTTVVNNSTGSGDNSTVVNNSTSSGASSGNVTAANATTGSNSTSSNSSAPVIVPVAINVNVNISLVIADNSTSTSTPLVVENVPSNSSNSSSSA